MSNPTIDGTSSTAVEYTVLYSSVDVVVFTFVLNTDVCPNSLTLSMVLEASMILGTLV